MLKHKVWYVYTKYVHVYTIYVHVYTSYVYMLVFKNKVWCVYAVYICMYKYYTYTCTCAHIRIAYTRRIEYIRHVVEISRILVPYVYMYTQHTPYVYIYMCHTFTCIYATRIRVCVCVCVCVQVMRRDMRIQQMTENEKHLRDAAATVLTFFNFFLFFLSNLVANKHACILHAPYRWDRKEKKKTKNQTTKKRNEQIIGKTRKWVEEK